MSLIYNKNKIMNNDLKKFYRSLYPQRSGLVFDEFTEKIQDPKSYMTPYIPEEREMHVTQMSVFDRLMMNRQIFFNDQVDSDTAGIVIAQLLYLNSVDVSDITMYINSPGGSISAGLGIIDAMGTSASDIRTINIGMAASMGSVLLAAGNKGKRQGLISSRVLLHEPRTGNGFGGTNTEYRIQMKELEICEEMLFNFLAIRTGKTYEQIKEVAGQNKDFWLSSTEALEYGIIDEIIGGDPKKAAVENLIEVWKDR